MAGVAFAAALTLASCNSDSENSYTTSVNVPAYNLYSPVSGDGTVSVGLGRYSVATTFPEQTIQLVGDMVYGGTSLSFTSVDMPFTAKYASVGDVNREVISFSATDATATGSKVTNLKATVTQAAYEPGNTSVPGYPERFVPGSSLHYLVADYILNGETHVRTFWPDMTFVGTTTTTYPGMDTFYTNTDISYRVIIQRDANNTLQNKADIIFYNAKFAPQAPEITVVLKDLDLAFTNNGYTISGTNVVPYMIEGSQLQETPRFAFDELHFYVLGDLTQAQATYKVAGIYSGDFRGRCIVSVN